MKAKDLRIGNLVYNKVGDIKVVRFIACLDEIHNCSIEEIQPIPITEDWLKRIGFKKSNAFWIDLTTHYLELIGPVHNYYYPVYAEIGELSSEPEQRVSLNRIQYVHQLQNLYFALTGEEL